MDLSNTTIHSEFSFMLAETKFYAQYWQAETTEAVILLVHGMGEHSDRYSGFFVDRFLEKNISVVAFDQFGHGRTEGKKGHTPGYDYNLDSIDFMLNKCKELFAGKPCFLYGHSMGGNLVATHILKRKSEIAGALLSSPMLRLAFTPPSWKLKVGALLRNIYPSFTEATGLNVNDISRDAEEVRKYKEDILVHDKVTINYSIPFFEAGEWALQNAGKLDKKLFIFHGTGDKITDFKATKTYAEKAGSNAKLKLYEGGYHELHNDLCKKEVLEDMTAWIKSIQ